MIHDRNIRSIDQIPHRRYNAIMSSARLPEVTGKAWEEEIIPCEHTHALTLEQFVSDPIQPSGLSF